MLSSEIHNIEGGKSALFNVCVNKEKFVGPLIFQALSTSRINYYYKTSAIDLENIQPLSFFFSEREQSADVTLLSDTPLRVYGSGNPDPSYLFADDFNPDSYVPPLSRTLSINYFPSQNIDSSEFQVVGRRNDNSTLFTTLKLLR